MPGKRTKTRQTSSSTSTSQEAQQVRPTVGLMGVFWDWVDTVTKEKDVNQIRFSCGDLRSTAGFDAQANILADLASAENVDGLVIWSDYIGHYIDADEMKVFCEQYHPLPVVSIGLIEGIPCVLVDNYQGAYDEVTHLIEAHDCRRIACIRGPAGNVEADERYRAYVDALAAHDIALDGKLVVTGGFSGATGEAAMKALFGRRKKAHFDALVAVTDEVAFAAIEFLQARGIQVPDDVAVVGFDDEGASYTPPVTSVRPAWREATMMSVEMVLALMAGDKVPERVVLPSQLVVRQSCGCPSGSVMHAAAGTWTQAGETFETALATRRDEILAAMVQAMEDPIEHLDPTWEVQPLGVLTAELKAHAERLLDAFAAELVGEAQGAFLPTLDELVLQTIATGSSANAWQGAISALRRHALPYLAGAKELARAEDLWQQARVLIGEKAERARVARATQARRQDAVLRRVGQALITTLDLEELTDLLAQELPDLGIPSCYLSLYGDPQAPTEWARLIMAYDERGRAKLEEGGRRFSSRQLAPRELLPQDRRYGFLVEPLYFRDNQIGFVLFESGPSGRVIYDTLREHISSALRGALLVQQVENRSRQLQTASEVSRAASSILDPQELIQQVVDLARKRFELYYAGLFLVGEGGEWAVLQAGTGKAGQEMLAQGHKLQVGGDSMIGQCVARAEARIALDVGEEAARFENPFLPETRSEMALPLVSRGRTLGALTIQSAKEAAFSQEDIAVLQTMADQLANAIENARLFEQAQIRAEELSTLNTIAATVSRSLKMQDLLGAALETTITTLRYDAGLISLYDGENGRLYLGSHQDLPETMVDKFEREGLAGTLCDVVFQTGDALGIGDLRQGAPVDVSGLIKNSLLAYVGSPIVYQDQVLGTFCLFSRSVQGPAAAELSLLEAIGQQIGIGIQNARLFDQTQVALAETEGQARRLALLSEMSEQLSRAATFEEIMDISANRVSRIFDADRASVAMLSAAGDSFEVFALRGEAGATPLGARVPAQGSEMEMAVRERHLIIKSDEPRPDMGNICSFMVAPLITGGEAIGTLNVASLQRDAYSERDGTLLLQTAAFISTAIENRRLFEQTQAALEEVEATYRRYLEREWREYAQTVRATSYETGRPDAPPLGDTVLPEIRQVMERQGTVALPGDGASGENRAALVTPIALRGTVIGALGIHSAEERQWTDDEIVLIEGIAERMALAAENLRLLDEAQRRATREQLTREVTDKMRNAADMDALMQTSIREIAATLGASSAFVQLGMLPAESGGDGRENKGTGPLPSLDATSNDESSRKG